MLSIGWQWQRAQPLGDLRGRLNPGPAFWHAQKRLPGNDTLASSTLFSWLPTTQKVSTEVTDF